MAEPWVQEEQCGFFSGHRTLDQLYALMKAQEVAWEFAQPVYKYFVDLEEAYDLVPQDFLWGCSGMG